MANDELLTNVENIIRSYFSSVVFIDDDINLNEGNITVVDDDIDYSVLDEEDYTNENAVSEHEQEVAVTDENNRYSPVEIINKFMDEGFIISPYSFNEEEYLQDDGRINKLIKNAKMIVLDWNLEKTKLPSDMGKNAIKIIEKIIQDNTGLKCCIIYTSCEDAKQQLKSLNKFIFKDDEEIDMFISKDESITNLIGFFSDKNISPKEIIENISTYLLKNKSVVLSFINSAIFFQQNMDKVLSKFNKSFETALYSQIMTSNMDNNQIYSFLSRFLLSSIEEEDMIHESFLFQIKSNSIRNFLSEKDNTELSEILRKIDIDFGGNIDNSFFSQENEYILAKVLKDIWLKDENKDFSNIKNKISKLIKKINNNLVNKISKNNIKCATKRLFIYSMFIDQFDGQKSIKKILANQLCTFTSLMKYKQISNERVETGTILKDGNKFLLCITPYCDIVRINNIDNKYKFLVGQEVGSIKKNDIDKLTTSLKNDVMAVPYDNKIIFIKWSFYDTIIIKGEMFEEKETVATLKKEYIQKVLNEYLAYQSRAGVSELFYKESYYINEFWDVVKEHIEF